MYTAQEYACILITKLEGWVSIPYRDPIAKSGVITIGYGTTMINGQPVSASIGAITKAQGIAYVAEYLTVFETQVRQKVPDILPHQLGAIMSLMYNEGGNPIMTSTLMSYMIKSEPIKAACEFPKWNYSGGHPIDGLLYRRCIEMYTFLSGEFSFEPTPEYLLLDKGVQI